MPNNPLTPVMVLGMLVLVWMIAELVNAIQQPKATCVHFWQTPEQVDGGFLLTCVHCGTTSFEVYP